MDNAIDSKNYAGRMLREIRMELGLTQQEVAFLLSHFKEDSHYVSRQTISKYENGERGMNLEVISDLSQVLKVPVQYFFAPSEIQNSSESFTLSIFETEDISLILHTKQKFNQLSFDKQCDLIDCMLEELLKFKRDFYRKNIDKIK